MHADGTGPSGASMPLPGGALRVATPVAVAACTRVGLCARALQVGVLHAIALRLVAGGVDEFVGALGFGQHDGLSLNRCGRSAAAVIALCGARSRALLAAGMRAEERPGVTGAAAPL